MDENTTLEQQTADQQDAFLEGWDDVEPATEPAETKPVDGGAAQAQQPNDQPAAADTVKHQDGGSDGEGGDGDPKPGDAPTETVPSWKVRHLGEEQTLTAKDVTPELLQKGLDYDRISEKWHEAKPVMELFTRFAKDANMSVADYTRHIREEAKKASGMSEEEAHNAVALEDREAAVAEKEAAQKEESAASAARAAKIQADITDFAAAFPDVYSKAKDDPKAIPQSVWDDVNGGKMSLTAAYSKYAVAAAQAEATAAREQASADAKNLENAGRSTGSMKSAGNDSKDTDPFLEGFNS